MEINLESELPDHKNKNKKEQPFIQDPRIIDVRKLVTLY